MSETPAEAPAQEQPNNTGPFAAEAEKADETDWKAEARKWEQRAKDNGAAAKEMEKQRQASMTEAEKAVAEAETRGRQSATADYGKRLARTEFDALAARRNPDFDTSSALEWIDLARFVGDDGDPDAKAITAAVERLVPEPAGGPPSLDLGSRTTAPAPQGMSQIIRKAAGRA
jgi:hypothetical protein